jgi:hypothetical protein
MLDIILHYRWFSVKEKDTWTIIYLVNYIFDLHDIFVDLGINVDDEGIMNAKSDLDFDNSGKIDLENLISWWHDKTLAMLKKGDQNKQKWLVIYAINARCHLTKKSV